MIREIVHIDEEKCDGCGLCVPACHEGAIQIFNGKARLRAEQLCDGLGACLGHCPQGAIRIERREANAFDESAVLAAGGSLTPNHAIAGHEPTRLPSATAGLMVRQPEQAAAGHSPGGCPSSRFAQLGSARKEPGRDMPAGDSPSGLAQWPVQLKLLPPTAPMLAGASLLLAADCAAFACGDFHARLLEGRVLAIACPKLDNPEGYLEKLTAMLTQGGVAEILVARMEVPCCGGLVRLALAARDAAGREDLPVREVLISTKGSVLGERRM